MNDIQHAIETFRQAQEEAKPKADAHTLQTMEWCDYLRSLRVGREAAEAKVEAQKTPERKGRTILVVDAEIHIVRYIEAVLQRAGYTTIGATNAKQAWDEYNRAAPDLVVMDLIIWTGSNGGFDLLGWIRKEDFHKPVIVLTAMVQISNQIRGYTLGAHVYLSKPLDIHALLIMVDQCLCSTPAELEALRYRNLASLLAEQNKRLEEEIEQLSKKQKDDTVSEDTN